MHFSKNLFLMPAVCVCAGFSIDVQAQLLDDIELRQEGVNAIAEIRLVTPVQYSRSISARSSDLVQAFYTVLPTRERILLEPSERRLPGAAGIPNIVVRDESASSTTVKNNNRKLVVSFGTSTRFKVRAGRNNRSIEIVLEGMGSAVQAAKLAAVKVVPVAPVVVAPVTVDTTVAVELNTTAAALLATAQTAFDSGDYSGATNSLNQLLNLPPNDSSRKAQELAGLAQLNAGDKLRAKSEFDLFLKLYPVGVDSDRIRALVASLPATGPTAVSDAKPVAEATSTTSGSLSMFYYGGKSNDRTRTEAFTSTGAPVPEVDPTVVPSDQKQLQTSVDLNWRFRDTEKDMRFVVRDSLTNDFVKTKDTSRERLSALYFDYKSLALGGNVRIGRQSPSGGGVMYRFDGVQAGYIFKPKWKINGVVGSPSEDLVDAKRSFYGLSVDAEALTKELSGSAFFIEQLIDGEIDRRAVGAELRYFKDGISASAQVDYDQILGKVNVAAFQSNWQVTEATAINAMFDHRTSPMLSLGNALFYDVIKDPITGAPVMAKRMQDFVGVVPIDVLRDRVISTTPYQNQFQIGTTTTLSTNWQTGASFSLSNVDEVPSFVFNGETIAGAPATGNQWGVSAQLIGTNLYSTRDTHVFNITFNGSLTDHGVLLSYNNLTSLGEQWQAEPSLKYYTRSSSLSGDADTFAAGLRGTYRVKNQISLESELTYEWTHTVSLPTTDVTTGISSKADSSRTGLTYYLGARYEF